MNLKIIMYIMSIQKFDKKKLDKGLIRNNKSFYISFDFIVRN